MFSIILSNLPQVKERNDLISGGYLGFSGKGIVAHPMSLITNNPLVI